jgi:hypothetical protein
MEISAKRYVDMIDTYVQLYGEKPRKASSPLEQMIIQKWMTLVSLDKTRRSSSNHSLEPCNGQYRSEDLILRQL